MSNVVHQLHRAKDHVPEDPGGRGIYKLNSSRKNEAAPQLGRLLFELFGVTFPAAG